MYNMHNSAKKKVTGSSTTNLGPMYKEQVVKGLTVPKFRTSLYESNYSKKAKKKASVASEPSEIIPGFLYLSGADTAANGDMLARNNITHIINISPCKNFYESKISNSLSQKYPNWKPSYLRLYIDDLPRENVERFFNISNMFIYEAEIMGGQVLVHCWAGVSRSVSLVLAFLMNRYELSYNKAFKYVKTRRSIISPNSGFRLQLSKYEIVLRVLKENGELEYDDVINKRVCIRSAAEGKNNAFDCRTKSILDPSINRYNKKRKAVVIEGDHNAQFIVLPPIASTTTTKRRKTVVDDNDNAQSLVTSLVTSTTTKKRRKTKKGILDRELEGVSKMSFRLADKAKKLRPAKIKAKQAITRYFAK